MRHRPKVTIRPEFFGTVPNFEGLSRKNYDVIRDAELSRIPNIVPNLSRFNVTIKCAAVDQNAVDYFYVFVCISKLCKYHNYGSFYQSNSVDCGSNIPHFMLQL